MAGSDTCQQIQRRDRDSVHRKATDARILRLMRPWQSAADAKKDMEKNRWL